MPVDYNYRCEVLNASLADIDQWLSNHALGAHATKVINRRSEWRLSARSRPVPVFEPDYIEVCLTDNRDRIALRESFDVRKMVFL